MKKKIVNGVVSLIMVAAISVPTLIPNSANIPVLSDVSLVQMIDADAASYTYTYYPKCKSSYTSFVDALKSVGVSDTSLTARKSIAALNGYSSYTGTAAQNTALLNKLKNGTLVKTKTAVATTTSSTVYYPKCKSSYTSFVDALKSVGISDTSLSARKSIAALNGYSSYTGTAAQNTALLNKLKNGTLIKSKGTSTTTTTTVAGVVSGNTYNKNGNVSVSNKAKENNPFYKNTGARSSAAYNQVINQFNVASNSRYKKTSTATYCNIFAWDVMSAMNVQLPHWVKNNVPSTYGTGNELNANATYNWLKNYGSKYGWSSVSASTAQSRANKGYPTVAIWYNTSGASGHVAVVRPEGNGYSYSSSKGPVIAQAGGSNFNYGNVSTGFGTGKMSKVMYYTHS